MTPDPAAPFYAHLERHPDDHMARLKFADWLEEQSNGTEPCGACGGVQLECEPGMGMCDLHLCPTCSGTGRVPDREVRRFDGWRAMGEFGRVAYYFYGSKDYGWTAQRCEATEQNESERLPNSWFDLLTGMTALAGRYVKTWDTRRAAEDAAAIAWGLLTPAEREKCREELTGSVIE